MKKRSLIIALSLVLVAVISVGATLAYFTAQTDTVTNMFTLGNISATISEPKWDATASHLLMPGDSYLKDPTITIGATSQPAWVFMKVTVTDAAALQAAVTAVSPDTDLLGGIAANLMPASWTSMATPSVFGDVKTYIYGYTTTLSASQSTSPIFTEITLPTSVDGSSTYTDLLTGFTITAQGFAVQAANVDTLAEAFTLAQAQFTEI